jgi:hypothetical protein
MSQTVAIIPGYPVSITQAAQDARMYRIAARDLRRAAKDAPGRAPEFEAKARRMERNARGCERAIVRYADSLLAE